MKDYASKIKPSSPQGKHDANMNSALLNDNSIQTYLHSLTSKERAEFYDELSNIDSFKHSLPLHFLFSKVRRHRKLETNFTSSQYCTHKFEGLTRMEKDILELVLAKIFNAFCKQIQSRLRCGWKAFCSACKASKEKDRVVAATIIQALVRGRKGRCHASKLRIKAETERKLKLKKALWLENKRNERSKKIQSLVRRFLVRKRLAFDRFTFNCASKIQRAWKSKVARNFAWEKINAMLHRECQAIIIQKWYRRFRCQVLVRYLFHCRKVEERRRPFVSRNYAISNHFMEIGAAIVIQRVWRKTRLKAPHKDDSLSSRESIMTQFQIPKQVTIKFESKEERSIYWNKNTLPTFLFGSRLKERKRESHVSQKYLLFLKSSPIRDAAVNILQRAIRYGIARRRMWKLIRINYRKVFLITGEANWYNDKTGKGTSVKPNFFGKLDIDNPVYCPDAKKSLERKCDFCGICQVRWYDAQAKEAYCNKCNIEIHSKGRQRNNDVFRIHVCVHCNMQTASKVCIACRDYYCDTCFVDQHKFTSILKLHPYWPLYKHCQYCQQSVALVRIKSTKESWDLCRSCHEQVLDNQSHSTVPISSFTTSLPATRLDGKDSKIIPPIDKRLSFSSTEIDLVPLSVRKLWGSDTK